MLKLREGTYYANLGLIRCDKCGSESVISIERKQFVMGNQENMFCPYCGRKTASIIGRTTDETRGAYELGPFTLIVKENEM